MSSSDFLRQLAAEAESQGPLVVGERDLGEWYAELTQIKANNGDERDFMRPTVALALEENIAPLIALAPQLALLCADMAEALDEVHVWICGPDLEDCGTSIDNCKYAPLLARLDALQPKDAA